MKEDKINRVDDEELFEMLFKRLKAILPNFRNVDDEELSEMLFKSLNAILPKFSNKEDEVVKVCSSYDFGDGSPVVEHEYEISSRDYYEGCFNTCLNEALSELTEREQKVIKYRFGFEEWGERHTMEEAEKHFGISRECVRKAEERALRRIFKIIHHEHMRKNRRKFLNDLEET